MGPLLPTSVVCPFVVFNVDGGNAGETGSEM
jgi:hypothetical protein